MSSTRQLLDNCFLHDKDRLRHDEALVMLKKQLAPVASVVEVRLEDAHRLVLAEDVVAPRNIPGHTNAAVDGYAVRHVDLVENDDTKLEVSLRVAAGETGELNLKPGTAARIFTGARMPAGADTALMQEDCEAADTHVVIPAGAKAGGNVRAAGEDFAKDCVVAQAGKRLKPQDMAAIAATGTASVRCYAPLSVALISTGDEILQPGENFLPGLVYDSNRFLLRALLDTVNAKVTDFGILSDDEQEVRSAVMRAAEGHDVILTSGGASKGEEDHIVDVVASQGSLHAWQLAIKPGKPLVFGQIADAVFMGLPGNPVAAFICFLLYAQPMFAHLQGANWTPPRRFAMPAGFSIAGKKPGRREFLRGWMESGKIHKFDRDGSGLISGLTAADGLIELPEEVTCVAKGDRLGFIPFTEFGFAH